MYYLTAIFFRLEFAQSFISCGLRIRPMHLYPWKPLSQAVMSQEELCPWGRRGEAGDTGTRGQSPVSSLPLPILHPVPSPFLVVKCQPLVLARFTLKERWTCHGNAAGKGSGHKEGLRSFLIPARPLVWPMLQPNACDPSSGIWLPPQGPLWPQAACLMVSFYSGYCFGILETQCEAAFLSLFADFEKVTEPHFSLWVFKYKLIIAPDTNTINF